MEKLNENLINIMKNNIHSSIEFANYLESYGYVNNLENCNFDYIKTLLVGFQLTLKKDYFVSRATLRQAIGNFDSVKIKNIVTLIAKISNGCPYIDEIKFYDCYDLINFIYSKIIKGEFELEDNFIIFKRDKVTGKVNLDNLINFSYCLSTSIKENKNEVMRRSIGINTIKTNERKRHITNKSALKYIVDHFYYIEFYDEPIHPRIRGDKYIEIVNSAYTYLISEIRRMSNGTSLQNIENVIQNFNNTLKKRGIKIAYKIKKSNDIEGRELIFNIYKKIYRDFDKQDLETQINYINMVLYSLADEASLKVNLSSNILAVGVLLKILEENREMTIEEAIKVTNSHQLFKWNDKNVLAMNLTNFYALYMYGLNEVFESSNVRLEDLYNNDFFDYSKFDFSKFKPTIFNYEENYSSIYDEFKILEDKYLRAKSRHERAINNYNTYIRTHNHSGFEKLGETIIILGDKINGARDELSKYEDYYEFSKKFIDSKLARYKYNKELIRHICKCIEQGNVFLKRHCLEDTLENSNLIFKEVKGSEVVFEMQVSVRGFLSFFDQENLNVLISRIKNYSVDKKKVLVLTSV